MKTKTRKLNHLVVMLCLNVFAAAPVLAEVRDAVILNFDPAISGGIPCLQLQPNPTMPNGGNDNIRITAYALNGSEETILETRIVSTGKQLQYPLPQRNKKEILGVKVEKQKGSNWHLIAEWRALYSNGESLLKYAGTEKLQRPADFKEFWNKARQNLKRIPMNARFVPVPDQSSSEADVYKVTIDSYGNIPIVGWYCVPKDVDIYEQTRAKKTYPAIQIMPGWGAEEPPNKALPKKGYIVFSLNPRSHGPSKEYFKTPIAHHLWNIDKPEDYYYVAAYMDCLRGIDFLMSRPEVDKSRVATKGGSQGGALALATAALDGRISCAVANVPYISNFPDFIRLAAGYSGKEFATNYHDPEKGSAVRQTLGYIDISNMTPLITCPTQVCVGLQDRVCPPLIGITAYNRLENTVPRELITDPSADHEVTRKMNSANMRWLEKYLKNSEGKKAE